MNKPGTGGSGFDPELAAKIEALEKKQALQPQQRRCPSCGTAALTTRLTCESCGNYYDRGNAQEEWDPKKLLLAKSGGGLSEEEEQLEALKSYLVRRTIAKVVDSLIVGSVVGMEYMTYFGLARALSSMPQFAPIMLNCFYWFMPILTIITLLGYQSAFEASPVQATPGKLLMNLYVVDIEGKQAQAEPLVFKAFLSYLPLLGFAGVYLYFFLSKFQYGRQLDAISTSVLAISGLAFFITFLALHIILGNEKKRQTIPDFLTGLTVRER
jgi:uncharacterized RDD family membrane protein YckC/ribosomal protein S27AE